MTPEVRKIVTGSRVRIQRLYPSTIEEMLVACEADRVIKERKAKGCRNVRYYDPEITPTPSFIADLCARVIALESTSHAPTTARAER